MSATIEKPPTVAQRATAATVQLRETFGFSNLKVMSTAIAEAAAEEAQQNSAFAERIRRIYQELSSNSQGKTAGTRPPRSAQKKSSLTPIARVEGFQPDPFAPIDPYFYLKIYGPEQFPLALDEQTLVTLKVIAEKLMADNPGTKPKTKSKKVDVIDYIVEIVAGKQ